MVSSVNHYFYFNPHEPTPSHPNAKMGGILIYKEGGKERKVKLSNRPKDHKVCVMAYDCLLQKAAEVYVSQRKLQTLLDVTFTRFPFLHRTVVKHQLESYFKLLAKYDPEQERVQMGQRLIMERKDLHALLKAAVQASLPPTEALDYTFKGRHYKILYDENKKLHILDVDSLTSYDNGNFARIYTLFDVAKGKQTVLKYALHDDDLKKECQIMEWIYLLLLQEENLTCFQKPFYKQVSICIEGSSAPVLGYLQKYYECGTLFNSVMSGVITELSSEARAQLLIEQGLSLVKGLRWMHEKQFYHGDIKAENILVTRKKGKIQLVYGDFGGATFKSVPTIHSEHYCISYDLEDIHDTRVPLGKRLVISEKMDVFALGVVLYALVSGQFPYHFKKEGDHEMPGEDAMCDSFGMGVASKLQKKGVPSTISTLIGDMLHWNYRKRASAQEVEEAWEKVVVSSKK